MCIDEEKPSWEEIGKMSEEIASLKEERDEWMKDKDKVPSEFNRIDLVGMVYIAAILGVFLAYGQYSWASLPFFIPMAVLFFWRGMEIRRRRR